MKNRVLFSIIEICARAAFGIRRLAVQVCDIVAKDEFTAAVAKVTLFTLFVGRLGARRGRRADAAKVHRERRDVPSGSIRST